MKYYNRNNPSLAINAINRPLDALKAEMQELCEALGQSFDESEFASEYEFSEVETICKKELADSDWRVSRAAERGEPLETVWKDYRESLRSLINNGASGEINWPVKPQ